MAKEKCDDSAGNLQLEHSSKDRSSRQRPQKKDKPKPLTKIIIRHLPPTMTEEEFLKQIDPLPEHDFYYYAAADWSLGYDATCRAYINLKHYDDVFLFRDRFDGYVFVDSKGAEYPAIVEFAPFQGLAKNKSRKIDPKVNSIELEQHYKNFLEKLEEEREAAAKGSGECKLEFSLNRKKEEKITSTPLLQYLANKKEKRREESKRRNDEKKRQREEEKERRQRNQQQQPVTKIMSNQEAGSRKDNNGAVGKAGTTNGGKENGGEEKVTHPNADEAKNSRSKRRAARDQRRREEHEQRKRERERHDREQREKCAVETNCADLQDTKEKEKSSFVVKENSNKSNADKSEDANRKEVKKYSEKRERKRNRKEQEQRSAAPIQDEVTIIASAPLNTDAAAAEAMNSTAKLDEISDTVKNFIRSVATVKEFVPKHKQAELEETQHNIKEELEKLSLTALEQKQTISLATAEEKRMETAAALEEKQLQKQRLSEERRIRNKDRPSIAIYQPKPRLRLSEESDSKDISAKDIPSNPNSDCENTKREEQPQCVKKPSRYSEKRSERRSKDKRMEKNTNESNNNEGKSSVKKSRPQVENSKDMSEKTET